MTIEERELLLKLTEEKRELPTLTKQELELQKLSLETLVLRGTLKRGAAPSPWEIAKSLGVFVPLMFAACGYYRSVEQDREAQLQRASEMFLGESPGVGSSLLNSHLEGFCTRGAACRAESEFILVGGVNLVDEVVATNRSLIALVALDELTLHGGAQRELCERLVVGLQRLESALVQTLVDGRAAKNGDTQDETEPSIERLKPIVCETVRVVGRSGEAETLHLRCWKSAVGPMGETMSVGHGIALYNLSCNLGSSLGADNPGTIDSRTTLADIKAGCGQESAKARE